jgi:N-acetylneuraminate synthase
MKRIPGKTYVVAEIGPSWIYGSDRAVNERTLLRLVDAAADAGADCVKVQLKAHGPGCFYDGDDLARPPHDAARAPFATRGEYVAQREPDEALLRLLAAECHARGIEWTASPWDLPSLELLLRFDVPWIKVASASLTNLPLLKAIAETGRHVVMSTGMSTPGEILAAVMVLEPGIAEYDLHQIMDRLTLAVCTATYPADADDLHLARIRRLGQRYNGVPVGWSSHSPDPAHAALAVAAGATWIETHVTTGKLRWGPDHAASLTPEEFARCVEGIRNAERAMGSGEIRVLPCEEAARARLRRTA